MRSLLVGLFALSALAVDVVPACAAWDNVFQPTLFGRCRKPAVSNYYAPPVVVSSSPVVSYSLPASNCTTCQSPPQQQCSTSYSQRCYYQPVTTMESRSYYESVTTQQKSYYYEPVTSYRYSSYYDPCTCGYQQVATPVTCYQLREKCCPVQSWVQRCVQVPVTTSQKVCYWQPQTTCCQTTQGAPIYGDAPPPGGMQPPPQVNTAPSISQPQGPPPNVNTDRAPGNGTSSPATPMYDRFYPPQQSITQPQSYPSQSPTMPPAGTSWQPKLGAPSPFVPENRPQGETQPIRALRPPVADRISLSELSPVPRG